jgi:hypothetical protein
MEVDMREILDLHIVQPCSFEFNGTQHCYGERVFALCIDGSVWVNGLGPRVDAKWGEWERLPDIPDVDD